MSVLVIAEPGCTHEGDKATILRLLETAAQCGANCWKPQWTSDPHQMLERRHIGPDHPKRAFYERAYSWLAFPLEWHAEFSERCHALNMQYAVTCFLPKDVVKIASWVDYFKVASFEAMDPDLCDAHDKHHKLVIVSCGMTDPSDAEETIGGYGTWGLDAVKFLHCTTAYPAPLPTINLRVLPQWEWRWFFDGLSDHSRHLLTGALAVACGAEIIETHYRLDDCDPENPDYAVAFTPAEFTQYIQNIRDAEVMLGSGKKTVQECEGWALPYRVGA